MKATGKFKVGDTVLVVSDDIHCGQVGTVTVGDDGDTFYPVRVIFPNDLETYEVFEEDELEVVSACGSSLFSVATAIVHGDRQRDYGSPYDHWTAVAARWGCPWREALLKMMDLKLERLKTTPSHTDSLIDLAGYILVWELCEAEEKNR